MWAWFSLRSPKLIKTWQAHKNVHDFAEPSVARASRQSKEFFNGLLNHWSCKYLNAMGPAEADCALKTRATAGDHHVSMPMLDALLLLNSLRAIEKEFSLQVWSAQIGNSLNAVEYMAAQLQQHYDDDDQVAPSSLNWQGMSRYEALSGSRHAPRTLMG
jgi:hypothetical protein